MKLSGKQLIEDNLKYSSNNRFVIIECSEDVDMKLDYFFIFDNNVVKLLRKEHELFLKINRHMIDKTISCCIQAKNGEVVLFNTNEISIKMDVPIKNNSAIEDIIGRIDKLELEIQNVYKELTLKYDKNKIETDRRIEKFNCFKPKFRVDTRRDLPTFNNNNYDLYFVGQDSSEYYDTMYWYDDRWVCLGKTKNPMNF